MVILLTSSGTAAITNYFNVYLDTALAVPIIIIGALSATNQLLSILFALVSPLLINSWGKERTIVFGLFMRSISLLPLALIPHWAGAGVGYIVAVAMTAITLPTFGVYHQESVPPKWRTAMSGAVNTATGLSNAMMAYGGAYIIINMGYRELFLLAAVLVAAGAMIVWVYTRNKSVGSRNSPSS